LGIQGSGPENTQLYYQVVSQAAHETGMYILRTEAADNNLHHWFLQEDNINDEGKLKMMLTACQISIHNLSYKAKVYYQDNSTDKWVYKEDVNDGKIKSYKVMACDSGAGKLFLPTEGKSDLDCLYLYNLINFFFGYIHSLTTNPDLLCLQVGLFFTQEIETNTTYKKLVKTVPLLIQQIDDFEVLIKSSSKELQSYWTFSTVETSFLTPRKEK